MKKFIFLILLSISGSAFSQVQEGIRAESQVYEKVDKTAEFPGGINAFRSSFQNNFDVENIQGTGRLETVITFVIESDGTITDIRASGGNVSFNNEAIRTVKKIISPFVPSELDGKKIPSHYRLPLTMVFN